MATSTNARDALFEAQRPRLEALGFDAGEIAEAVRRLDGRKQRPLAYFMGVNATDNAGNLTDCARALIAYAVGGGDIIEARING